jgi:Domain of unknown function (DUF4145)
MANSFEHLKSRIESLPEHLRILKRRLHDSVDEAEQRPASALRSFQATIESIVARVYEILLGQAPKEKPFFDQLKKLEEQNAIRPALLNHLNYLRVFRNQTTHRIQIEDSLSREDFEAVVYVVLLFLEWASPMLRVCDHCTAVIPRPAVQCPCCGLARNAEPEPANPASDPRTDSTSVTREVSPVVG